MILAIFAITLVAVALTRLPGIRIDRPAAALAGAIAMVLAGAFTIREAADAVDWNTIALLLGMMVIIAGVQQDGAVTHLTDAVFGGARSPVGLLVRVVLLAAIASAFLVNDAVVLVLTPVLIVYCRNRGLNPIPYLIAEAMASNIGGVATITGNPQNALIGLQSGISFGRFFLHLVPIAAVSCVVLLAAIRLRYQKEVSRPLTTAPVVSGGADGVMLRPRWLTRSTIVLIGIVIAFAISPYTSVTISEIALIGAAVVLLASGHNPQELFRRVDWTLLLLFVGLFIVIGAAVNDGLFDWARNDLSLGNNAGSVATLHAASMGVSQIISNVPFTILMLPILQPHNSNLLWLSLASGATLAGNLTLIGSIANLIVAEGAGRQNVRLGFGEYLATGVPVALVTAGASILILWLEHATGWL
ncbi:MAG: anion transporter [Chloroflexi bacterium]|nr:anion transporter [Chloroflexota bacterium]